AASKGIVDSRDLAFSLCCTFFFTAASAAAVQHKRGNDSWNFRRQLALATGAFILLVLNSNVFYFRLDLTQEKRFSATPFSKTLLSELEAPLTISYYRSAVLRRLYSQVRDIEDFIRVYADSGRRMDYEIIDPADKGLEDRLESYGIRPQEIELEGSAGNSRLQVFSAITLRYKGQTEVIPFLLGMDTLEYDLSSRIQTLVRGTERRVHIIVGNGLSLDTDYPYLVPWLSLQGFSVAEEDLSFLSAGKLDPAAQEECLVLAGSSDLSFPQAQALISYIDGGGKAFIATTPYTVDTLGDWTTQRSYDNLTALLLKYGICFKDGMTASSSCFLMSLQGENNASLSEQLAYPLWPVIAPQKEAGKGLQLYWPCALALDGEVAESEGLQLDAFLWTDGRSWQSGADGGEFVTNPFTVSPKALPGDEQGSFPCAVRASRGGKPAFYVWGDQYALSSRMMAFSTGPSGAVDTRGLELLSDSLLRLMGQGELLKLKKPARLSSDGQASTLKTASAVCLIFPLILLLALFTILRIERKRLIHRLQLIWGKSS
ncbi:MAG: GldG family protein, partial [Treponema sp.]|nr:GldG family protein [Treponema sp.]